jgi:hypothetical protein
MIPVCQGSVEDVVLSLILNGGVEKGVYTYIYSNHQKTH